MVQLFPRVDVGHLKAEEDSANIGATHLVAPWMDEVEDNRIDRAPTFATLLEMNSEDEAKVGRTNIGSTSDAILVVGPNTSTNVPTDLSIVSHNADIVQWHKMAPTTYAHVEIIVS